MSWLGLLLAVGVGVTLGFFGGGGSILTVPLLVYGFGLEVKAAFASSLLVVSAASATAALQYARAGQLRVRVALVFGAAGMAGAYLGGRAAAFLDGGVLLLLFACLMILTARALWRARGAPAPPGAPAPAPGKLLLQGFGVGAFTGLVGAGGGFLIVPAFVLFAGLPMSAAVGTSLLVIVFTSLAGFAGYAAHVSVQPELVAAVASCAVAGSLAGARLGRLVPPARLRRAFAGFVLGMAALILVREAALVLETGREALPHTLPQLFFAALMLAVGVAAGRSSRAPGFGPAQRATFELGEGI